MAYAWIITRDYGYEESVAMDMADGEKSKVGKIRGSRDGLMMFRDRLRLFLDMVNTGQEVSLEPVDVSYIHEDSNIVQTISAEVIRWRTVSDLYETNDHPDYEGFLLCDGQDGEMEDEDPVIRPYEYSVNDVGSVSLFLMDANGEWKHTYG